MAGWDPRGWALYSNDWAESVLWEPAAWVPGRDGAWAQEAGVEPRRAEGGLSVGGYGVRVLQRPLRCRLRKESV